jgi:hypothetical protein
MSPPRSTLPLPRYVLRKPLKNGTWAYFFNIPMWARASGCPVRNEPLGTDYAAAVSRAETVLLPALDSWRSSGESDTPPTAGVVRAGTLDWVFAEYRADRRFTRLDVRTKRNHEVGFRFVGGYLLKDGTRLGQARLYSITSAIVDVLYEKLLMIKETDASGNVIERERRTTINHAMKTSRRAWNIAERRNPGKLPSNPFARMGLLGSKRETPHRNLRGFEDFPCDGGQNGFPIACHRGVHRVGVVAAGKGHLRHVRCNALSAEGAAACGPRSAREDRRGKLDPTIRRCRCIQS